MSYVTFYKLRIDPLLQRFGTIRKGIHFIKIIIEFEKEIEICIYTNPMLSVH